MDKCRITVFTPTYNRAYILSNLYESLKRQSFSDFEWLVVDDGSTDNTEAVFENWMREENKFSIRYYKQANGGKHRAVNKGMDLALGEFFFVVDSDDYLTDDALEKIDYWFHSIDRHSMIAGVVANKGYSQTKTENSLFRSDYIDIDFLSALQYEENGNRVLVGERAIAFFTDVCRTYKYPEFENEKFVTEAVAYNRMAHDGYKMRFYNDIIWIFEYKDDGLTKSGFRLFADNPHGYGLWFKELSEYKRDGMIKKLKLYYSFTCDLKDRYNDRIIAECIGTKTLIISACRLVSDIKKYLRGKK